MKIALIYNPAAGGIRRRPEGLERSVAILKGQGHEIDMRPTTGPETAGPIARACIEAGAEMIVAAGGDGTINETANGMIGSSIPLAPLPAGTANVLCMELGIGKRMESAAEKLAQATPERIAAGVLITGASRRYFLLMAGVGLDALIVSRLNSALKNKTGKFAYWVAGLGLASERLHEFEVTADGRRQRCSFALASRVRNYGGDLEIATGASLRHRHFELVTFEGASSLRYIKYLGGVLLRRTSRMRGVTVCKATSLEIAPAPGGHVFVQVDGELAGRLPARIEIVEDALTLMMPGHYR